MASENAIDAIYHIRVGHFHGESELRFGSALMRKKI